MARVPELKRLSTGCPGKKMIGASWLHKEIFQWMLWQYISPEEVADLPKQEVQLGPTLKVARGYPCHTNYGLTMGGCYHGNSIPNVYPLIYLELESILVAIYGN